MKQQYIIYVPGLSDQVWIHKFSFKLLMHIWKLYGVKGYVVEPHWSENKSFLPILKKITDKIDKIYSKGHKVSLVGQSAGGSAVFIAYCQRKEKVNKVVNITGALRFTPEFENKLIKRGKTVVAHKDTIKLFINKYEKTLTNTDKKKIMTIRPLNDKVVPAICVPLSGATNLVAPVIGHVVGGAFICTFWAYKFINFIKTLN